MKSGESLEWLHKLRYASSVNLHECFRKSRAFILSEGSLNSGWFLPQSQLKFQLEVKVKLNQTRMLLHVHGSFLKNFICK